MRASFFLHLSPANAEEVDNEMAILCDENINDDDDDDGEEQE